jgi:hypothetical protein
MNATFGRTCLVLGLLSLSLAAALSVDPKARHDGVTVHAQVASTMLLQSAPEDDDAEASVAPESDESVKLASCGERDCPALKQEIALSLRDDRHSLESKAFVAAGDEIRPKSKD